MRIKHRYLQFESHLKIIKPVKAILDKHFHIYKYKEDLECVIPTFKYTIEFYLYEDNPKFDTLKNEINKFLQPQFVGTEYEKIDIKNAEWFIVNAGEYQYPQPEDDYGYLKTTFNTENYCKICGVGKVQNAPYRLRTLPKQPNNQFWGLHWEFEAIFVREETKNIFEKENINGISFSNPVLNKKNITIENFYQLHIDTILGKGFDNYNTQTITCKINNEEGLNTDNNLKCCSRQKFHHPRIGGYLFDKNLFDKNLDIVESNEYFGSGASASRLQIISKRIKNLIDKNKLKGLSFIPIMHERLVR
jgi:hypothetical protein